MMRSYNLFVVIIGIMGYVLIPIPLFLDLSNLDLVIESESFPSISTPLPLSYLFLSLHIVIYQIMAIFRRNQFISFINNKRMKFTLSSFAIFLFLWMSLVSKVDLSKIIQVMLPLLGCIFYISPKDTRVNENIFNVTIFSGTIFFIMHLSYLSTLAIPLTAINEYDFQYFYGIAIYQALLSYPSVLSFYAVILFYLSIKHIKTLGFIYLLISLLIMILISLAARRAAIIEFLIFIVLTTILMSSYVIKYNKIKKYFFIFIMFYLPLILLSVLYMSKLPIGQRISRTYESGNIGESRLVIYSKAIKDFSNNIEGLLIGRAGKSGAHNYFLDILYNVGLIPIIVFILMILLYMLRSSIQVKKYTPKHSLLNIQTLLLIGLATGALVQSTVNASITQPYYLANLLLIFLYYKNENRLKEG